MKKRIKIIAAALSIIVMGECFCGCGKKKESIGSSAPASDEGQATSVSLDTGRNLKIHTLKNHMSDAERASVTKGPLRLLDKPWEKGTTAGEYGDGVYVELWTREDFLRDMEEHPEVYSYMTPEELEEYKANCVSSIRGFTVDGRNYGCMIIPGCVDVYGFYYTYKDGQFEPSEIRDMEDLKRILPDLMKEYQKEEYQYTYISDAFDPEQMEKAMVLAMSPTIGVPCTPRVLVPALCTTHVGGAILMGMYAGRLCMKVDMTVNVPFDVMLAMAAQIHVESGKALVPVVVEYMEPFFKRKKEVESLVSPEVRDAEAKKIQETLEKARQKSKQLAQGTESILHTLGDAVVGGSSQAVGSPTNAARICHELARGKIRKIRIELYPELFARRSINVPGILMGAVYGASTSDYEMYGKAVQMVKNDGIEVEIVEGKEHAIQKITLFTDQMTCTVDTLNRGGGRLVLRDASPSLEEAAAAARRLGIVLV